jgi:hypothetical protein
VVGLLGRLGDQVGSEWVAVRAVIDAAPGGRGNEGLVGFLICPSAVLLGDFWDFTHCH